MLAASPFCGAQGNTASGTAEEHLHAGAGLLRSGQAQQALEEFREANRLAPTQAQPLVWMGIADNQLGHFQDAVSAFRSALKIDPTGQSAHYNLSLSLVKLGETRAAIHELEAVVAQNPSLVDAQFNLAVLLEQEGRYAEAIPHLEIAQQQGGDDAGLALRLVEAYLKTGKQELAAPLIQKHPELAAQGQIATLRASSLIEHGQFAEAIPILEPAAADSQSSPAIKLLLARAYLGADQADKAIALLRPQSGTNMAGETAYLLGLAYTMTGDATDAIESFRTAIARSPQNAAAHFRLGSLLLASAEASAHADGRAEIEKAISISPRQEEYYVALGKWMLENNQPRDAVNVLDSGVHAATPSAQLYLLLAISQATILGPAAAQPTILKAVALDPRLGLAHNILGFCYFHAGEYAQAVDSYRQAATLNPESGPFAYDVALAMERMNRIAEAIPYAERAVAHDPSRGPDHYLLGKLYTKANRKPDAIPQLEAAVQLSPNSDYAYYLLARTYMQLGNSAKAQEWNRKFQELKQSHDKDVGLAPPSSEPSEDLSPSLVLGTTKSSSGASGQEPPRP